MSALVSRTASVRGPPTILLDQDAAQRNAREVADVGEQERNPREQPISASVNPRSALRYFGATQ